MFFFYTNIVDKCRFQKPNSKSEAMQFYAQSINLLEPSRDIQKRGLRRKFKVSTVDIEI